MDDNWGSVIVVDFTSLRMFYHVSIENEWHISFVKVDPSWNEYSYADDYIFSYLDDCKIAIGRRLEQA